LNAPPIRRTQLRLSCWHGLTIQQLLGVRDTPDPVMARDWYRKAAGFGSADAQQRLTQLQN